MTIWEKIARVTRDEHVLEAIDVFAKGETKSQKDPEFVKTGLSYIRQAAYDNGDPNAYMVDAACAAYESEAGRGGDNLPRFTQQSDGTFRVRRD